MPILEITEIEQNEWNVQAVTPAVHLYGGQGKALHVWCVYYENKVKARKFLILCTGTLQWLWI